ncbi:MAG: DUF5606 domain-containing protein [Bacteroidota bacterium]
MNLRTIATIAGRSGLFRIIKPTRNGVIVETIDAQKSRTVAGATNKVSVLQEITIYTTDNDGSITLQEVLRGIREKFGEKLPVDTKASGAELHDFMKEAVPAYDIDRVYTGDIKKLVGWYTILSNFAPEAFEEEKAADAESNSEDTPGDKAAGSVAGEEPAKAADAALGSEKPQL